MAENYEDTNDCKARELDGYDSLKNDLALRNFLSKEVKNESLEFIDYAPSISLVRAAIIDTMYTIGMKVPERLEKQVGLSKN